MDDTPRVGPLSYSVESVHGDVSAERPIVVGSVAVIVASIPAAALAWVALGAVAARQLVLLTASLAGPAIGVALAAYLGRDGARRRRNAMLGVGAVGLFVALVSYNLLGIVRPAVPELRAAIDDVRLPAGFVQVSEDAGGDRLCKSRCPTVERVYRADGVTDPGRELLRAMFRQGWDPADPNVPPDSNTAAIRGRVLVDVYSSTGETTVRVVVTGSAGQFGGVQG